MKKIILSILFFASGVFETYAQLYESRHFNIEKLSEGVYAAIAKTGGFAICNAAIIDLGDATLVFDPFMTPEAAKDLKACAINLTGKEVNYVVNSHFHNDHVGGNQVFEQAEIISTKTTRVLMEKILPGEIEENSKNAKSILENISKAPTAQMNAHEQEEHRMSIGYFEGLVSSGDSLKLVLPDKYVTDVFEIKGSRRKIQLISMGKGHTESDLVLYLPKEKIVFSGDLLFINHHPWIGDGDIDSWNVCLKRIQDMKPRKIVPGHGPVGGVADLDSLNSYFISLEMLAATYHADGKSPAEDQDLKMPEAFSGWYLSNFFRPNLIAVYKK